jgi:hypothetical protein
VYKIVETIAIKKAQEQTTGVEERLKRVDEMERTVAREKAEADLLKLHPDFDTIRDEDDFHEWAEQQPKWIQDACTTTTMTLVLPPVQLICTRLIWVLSRKKRKTLVKTQPDLLALAASVRRLMVTGTEGVIYESQVAKMSIKEYEARAEEIQKAMRTGKFVYDMSGSAR